HPIPIADRLHCDRRARLTSRQKLLERSPLMREPLFADELTVRPSHRRQGVMFVGIERDIFHLLRLLSRLTPSSVVQRPRSSHPWRRRSAFIPSKVAGSNQAPAT